MTSAAFARKTIISMALRRQRPELFEEEARYVLDSEVRHALVRGDRTALLVRSYSGVFTRRAVRELVPRTAGKPAAIWRENQRQLSVSPSGVPAGSHLLPNRHARVS